ncbi:MAG: aromatic ring-hydroxylating dioxygenase subunit alpha [Pseudomonadota bacterium]
MFPLEANCVYPRNEWYVGALSHEVGRTLFERKILDEPVVFYRTEEGKAVAMAGLCPHRLYPMVKGKLIGDTVECGYHGLTFGCDGVCTRIPSQDTVPKSFKTRIFPTFEKAGWVWIWMGDADLADTGKVPLAYCQPGWDTQFVKTYHVQARYTLLIENLMDLSHISYLHGRSLPGDAFSKFPVVLEERADSFRAVRKVTNQPYDGYSTFLFGPGSGTQDFDAPTDYHSPALIISGSVHRLSSGEHLGAMRFLHALTPETPTTTHYFGGSTRDFRQGDEQLSQALLGLDDVVRQEDADGLAAIEPYIGQHADFKKELSVTADSGAIRVRRMLSRQIKSELGVASAASEGLSVVKVS